MRLFDANQDGRLTVNELIRTVDDFFESHVTEADIITMLAVLQLPLVVEEGVVVVVDDDEDDEDGTSSAVVKDKDEYEPPPSVSIQDFVRSDTAAMRRFFLTLLEEDPSKRSRHSRMAWLTNTGASSSSSSSSSSRTDANARTTKDQPDQEMMEAIQHRVALLTHLPETVVHNAMELQVVHYDYNNNNNTKGGGHYTAHFDSLARSSEQLRALPCCHITNRVPPCRPCRMATILYSLSDVEEGGHTAFPLATNTKSNSNSNSSTYNNNNNHTAESVEDWRMSSASRESSYCAADGPGLRIPPKLGQAILWYNHDIGHLKPTERYNTALPTMMLVPLLGDLDRSTLHAGCPSSSTTTSTTSTTSTTPPWNAPGKWIANHWIEASDIYGEDAEHHATMMSNN